MRSLPKKRQKQRSEARSPSNKPKPKSKERALWRKRNFLEAEQIVPQEIHEKEKSRSKRKPKRKATLLIARGEAEAILADQASRSEGIQKLLDAKAKGYKQLVEACGDDAKSASTMLLIEKLEEIVKLQTEAIKNIKIDKITVWDSGSQRDPSKGLHHLQFHQPICQVSSRPPRCRLDGRPRTAPIPRPNQTRCLG